MNRNRVCECLMCVLLVASVLSGATAVVGNKVVAFGGGQLHCWPQPAGAAMDVRIPSNAVSGFPLLVRLSVSVYEGQPKVEWVVGLAADQNVFIPALALGFDNDAGEGYRLGEPGFWDDHPMGDSSGPRLLLRDGDGITHWFDLARLARSRRLGASWGKAKVRGRNFSYAVEEPIPVVGTWSVSVIRGAFLSLHQNTIVVREPNQDEKRVIELLRTQGAGLSWFPDVVLEGEEIPEDLVRRLPAETHRTVRLIQILRAAFVSPQDGLDALYLYTAEDWGYLQPLVDLVQYECLRDVNRDKEAEAVRSRWKDDPTLKTNYRLVDEGLGLIARFHKDVERRLSSARTESDRIQE